VSALGRAGRAAIVLAAAYAVARLGGGGAPPPAMPRPAARAPEAPPPPRAHHAEGLEVRLRLVEALGDARASVPSLAASQGLFGLHWRKMHPPFLALPADAQALAWSIALRTSAEETQAVVPTGSGAWSPDARVWNMSEGSFDQRDAIFAPAPATLDFHVKVPAGARFTFAPGTINVASDAVTFAVLVVDARGAEHTVYERRVAPVEMRRWLEADVDLAAFAGQEVDLRLRTTPSPATPEELPPRLARRALMAPPGGDADLEAKDQARERALSTPSAQALAVWGNPSLLGRSETEVPYNVLWIVIDALRNDVLASLHDDDEDAARQRAHVPPLEAFLPKLEGLTPSIDALAAKSVRFTHAYSAAPWTRPGTLAMLSGARASELGADTLHWQLKDEDAARFYASSPPLLPLILGHEGVLTRAFVNNFFMGGYASVGLDFGFERQHDHRQHVRDTAEITAEATAWLRANRDDRFFLFCNYNSPHEPWEPPPEMLARVPAPPVGPSDPKTRLYLGEAVKDDAAVGELLALVDELGLRDKTIVVLTADHGETISSAHSAKSILDHMVMRFHHAASNFEETTRIPILLSLPGVLEPRTVKERVRNTDIVPTILDLEGVDATAARAKMSGRTLLGLARGETEADARVIVSEGRGTRAILSGKYRYVAREPAAQKLQIGDREVMVADELYDLEDDPGERHNIAHDHPDVVAEMRARLDAAIHNVPVVGTQASVAPASGGASDGAAPVVHLRFAGAGQARRVTGVLRAGEGDSAHVALTPVGLGALSFDQKGGVATLAFTTAEDGVVGFDVRVTPPDAPLRWELTLDDQPWPAGHVFAGAYGVAADALRAGMTGEEARTAAAAAVLPFVDPSVDLGLFVTRDRGAAAPAARVTRAEGAEEMGRMLRAWGYASGSGGSAR
jgi:arylsulfatase A-like enzyme